MLYQGYFDMIYPIAQKQAKMAHQESTDISKVNTHRTDNKHHHAEIDLSQVKMVANQEKMRQRTKKNKLKKIEDDINEKAELMKKDMVDQGEDEKLLILQQISQKRLKKLSTIAIKFPKLNNLEHNPKFK